MRIIEYIKKDNPLVFNHSIILEKENIRYVGRIVYILSLVYFLCYKNTTNKNDTTYNDMSFTTKLILTHVQLMFRLNVRRIKDFGINPYLFALVLVSFFILTIKISMESLNHYFPHSIVLIASFSLLIQEKQSRVSFLKTCYNKKDYLAIRFTEKLIILFPFFLILLVIAPIFSLVLLLLLPISWYTSFKSTYCFAIRTPFGRQPFEFTIGFRKNLLVIVFCYLCSFMGLYHDNLNLSIVSLIFLYLNIIFYYSTREDRLLIWIFCCTPSRFLLNKIRSSLLYTTLLILPIVLPLSIAHFSRIYLLLIVCIAGYLYVIASILMKYTTVEQPVPPAKDMINYLLLFLLPPFITIPLFYMEAVSQLTQTLYDNNKLSNKKIWK